MCVPCPARRIVPLLRRPPHTVGPADILTTPKNWDDCPEQQAQIRVWSLVRNRPSVDTATAFFEAWADSVKFKRDKETTTRMMQRGPIPAEQMVMIIENFPSQIEAISSRLSLCNEGPFPLDHGGFLHSNIIMNEDSFDITGIIEWESACTVPWGLPEFLTAIPISFDLPQKYDQDGQPFGQELREKWRERREYIEMVRLAELKDSLLSACLSSKRGQTIAYVYGTYTSFGKLGFYDRVVEELESKE